MKNLDTWERCKEANVTIQSSQDNIPLHSGGNPTCVSTSRTRHHDLNQHNTQPPQPVQTKDILQRSDLLHLQDHLGRTTETVKKEFTTKSLQERCFYRERECLSNNQSWQHTFMYLNGWEIWHIVTLIRSLWEGRCYIFAGIWCLKHLLTGIIACSRKPFSSILETLFMNLYNYN